MSTEHTLQNWFIQVVGEEVNPETGETETVRHRVKSNDPLTFVDGATFPVFDCDETIVLGVEDAGE